VSVKIAVCKADAASFPSKEYSLPSTDTIVLPNLIIFAAPITLPANSGL
jgi:hypothetical protein